MRTYRFGDFGLDLDALQLRLHGVPVKLERRPLDLLILLVNRHGRLVTREDIITTLWPARVIIDFEAGLNTLVRKVRHALGDDSDEPRFVETVPGRGYRFIATVTEVAERESVRGPVAAELPSVPAAAPIAMPASAPAARLAQAVAVGPRWRGRPAAALLVSTIAVAVVVLPWFIFTRQSIDGPIEQIATSTQIVELAVLPFKPLTASDRNESLELGMAETLIAGLNGTGRLQVMPLSSVRRYAGPERDAVEAGRTLGVAAVLEGYMQRTDDRLRVSARLLDTRDGRQLWTERYDEEFTDIFTVQDAIAARVQAALTPEMVGAPIARLTHDTSDAEAYQLYANGRFYLRRNEAGMRRAIEYFGQAIGRDPGFARSYVGLAEGYSMLGVFGAMAPHEAFPRARAAVDTALMLQPDLGEAYAALGHIKAQYELDWPGAERAYRRAIELNPSFALGQQLYGHYLAYVGRIEDGLGQVRKAQALEPASPIYGAVIGLFLCFERRYDEAVEQLNKTLETDADLDLAHTYLAVAYMYRGEYERAIEHLSRVSSVTPGSGGYLGQIYALSGRRADALAEIDRLIALAEHRNFAAHDIAAIHAALGDADQTFLWLDRALDDRSQLLGWIRWNPVFDSVRDDPRYAEFMHRLGLG